MRILLVIISFFSLSFSNLAKEKITKMDNSQNYYTISTDSKQSTNIEGINVIYSTIFHHPGPIPGKETGTIAWVGHTFFVSETPINRKDLKAEKSLDTKKIFKVHYSFWTKDGGFKINNKEYFLEVLEEPNSNNVENAINKVQGPVKIRILQKKPLK